MSSSSLKIGIVGLPNVGKSTLFTALTKKKADIANYPFSTIEPNLGIVEVPDERLAKLSRMSNSRKTIPAIIEFVDIAGLVKGASDGQGLGNKFLAHIKEVDAIAQVVRVFEDKEIIHLSEEPNPLSDIEVVEYELILKDLEVISKREENLERDVKGQKKGADDELELVKKIKKKLQEGKLIFPEWKRIIEPEKEEAVKSVDGLRLLTAKPIIYVLNASEKEIQDRWKPANALAEKINNSPFVVISAKVEFELAELSDAEKKEYLAALGVKESGLEQLIRVGYQTLGLLTFFTAGEDESRAWTIPAGSKAPRAGAAIHSDFEEKFIRAEAINWQKLLDAGSWTKARELGRLGIEGKEYVVEDGDVIEFKI